MMSLLKLAYRSVGQLGWDPRVTARALKGIPRFVTELIRFRQQYEGLLEIQPCLHDRGDQAGSVLGEYFWQDLLVAQQIFRRNPSKHVDVGSRVDGFVAHVAAFRDLEVFDVRPLTDNIPNVAFRQQNMMSPAFALEAYCDSVSCLHALEHFGLGRYGDPIETDGFELGLRNLAQLLTSGGTLYLSVPVGKPRVAFNAHRVLDPVHVTNSARSHGLELTEFGLVLPGRVERHSPEGVSAGRHDYALGLFVLRKS